MSSFGIHTLDICKQQRESRHLIRVDTCIILLKNIFIMANFYCEYCGTKSARVASLVSGYCPRHPNGPNKGKHKLFEGGEKTAYTCKYCGINNRNLSSLTSGYCPRHPSGPNKGRHAPAL